MSIAVFAGTFDPFTVGHLDIVKRASVHFEKLYVAICRNPGKAEPMFTLEERAALITEAVEGVKNAEVSFFDGLLADYCKSVGADCLIRSIRSGYDVDYERQLESVNRGLSNSLDTMYLLARPELSYISSTLVRQLIEIGISIENLVPNSDNAIITNKTNRRK